MIPDEQNIPPGKMAQVQSSPFWVAVFVVWIVMLAAAGTLALALAIWNLWQAF